MSPRPLSPYDQMLLTQAVTLHQGGHFAQASALYRQLLEVQPRHADILRMLGTAECQAGHFETSLEFLRRSLKIAPNNPDTHHNLANALRDAGRPDEALAIYKRVLAMTPKDPEVFNNRGNALQDLKRFDDALADYAAALAIRPEHIDAHLNQGTALLGLGRFAEAVTCCDWVLARAPDDADAWGNRALALKGLERHEAALQDVGRALALKPGHAKAHYIRGGILMSLQRFEEASASYDRALALNPDLEWLFGQALYMRMYLADWTQFSHMRDELATRIADGKKATAPLPVQAFLDAPEVLQRTADRFTADLFPAQARPALPATRARHDRIRVAYVSSDFRSHPVSHLLAGMFEHHDKTRFEIFVISLGPDSDDAWQTRIRAAADHFIDASKMPYTQLIEMARELEIDIAIDLNGFTKDNRTEVFAARIAPVQVSYIGYLGTMGAPYMDYLIADSVIIPPDQRTFYSEKIAELPSYQINDDRQTMAPTVFSRRSLGLPDSGFVFCTFNQAYKILPEIFDAWMRILKQVPDSVLWLFANTQTARRNLTREAQARGVAASRLIFAEMLPLEDHLARLKRADLFLDTFPYNAGAMASGAFRAGLPVLTRIGQSFASRMGASLLSAVGLPELITQTPDAYEALAIELATQPDRMAALRQKLQITCPPAHCSIRRRRRAIWKRFLRPCTHVQCMACGRIISKFNPEQVLPPMRMP